MQKVRFDYERQAWVVNGKYARCGHLETCNCYGRLHEGEIAPELAEDTVAVI